MRGRAFQWRVSAPSYTQTPFDNNATAWILSEDVDNNSSKITFGCWLNPNAFTGTVRLYRNQDNIGNVTIRSDGKVDVNFKDTAGTNLIDVRTTDIVLTTGVRSFIYVSLDAGTPAFSLMVGGSSPALDVITAINAGNGTVSVAGRKSIMSTNSGTGLLDAKIGDYFFTAGEIISHATLYNGGTPPDLTGVGSPLIYLGGAQAASNLNSYENLGSLSLGAGDTGWT